MCMRHARSILARLFITPLSPSTSRAICSVSFKLSLYTAPQLYILLISFRLFHTIKFNSPFFCRSHNTRTVPYNCLISTMLLLYKTLNTDPPRAPTAAPQSFDVIFTRVFFFLRRTKMIGLRPIVQIFNYDIAGSACLGGFRFILCCADILR